MPISRFFSHTKSKNQNSSASNSSSRPSLPQDPTPGFRNQGLGTRVPSQHLQASDRAALIMPAVQGREVATGPAATDSSLLAPMQPNDMTASQLSMERDELALVPYASQETRALALPSQQPQGQPQHSQRTGSVSSPGFVTTHNADNRKRLSNQPPPKRRKILSLDGGGVRGLSMILMLKHLMRGLNRERGVSLQPWEEFDMIGGTSTGGIIAIMLGRLHMSLDECERTYKEMSQRIFTSTTRNSADPRRLYDFLRADGKFEVEPLEDTIRVILEGKNMAEDQVLRDEHEDSCKVFVCTTRGLNGSPVVLRSYHSSKIDPYYEDCTIWKSVRATSAASTLFDPIELGPQDEPMVDGAFRRNNPIVEARIEALEAWPNEECMFISLGTGTSPGKSLLVNLLSLAEKLRDIVVDTEQTAKDFVSQHRLLEQEGCYFRFSVNDGSMAGIGLEEWRKAREIAGNTYTYLQEPSVEIGFKRCIENLCHGGQRLGFATSQELATIAERLRFQKIVAAICGICFRDTSFYVEYFYCSGCHLNLCVNCHSSHAKTHAQNLSLFTTMPWSVKSKDFEDNGSCAKCSRDAKCRVECTACLWSICLRCFNVSHLRDQWFENHRDDHSSKDHKRYRRIVPPYFSLNPVTSDICKCLSGSGVWGHCQRCHEAMELRRNLYCCKTCWEEYGDTQDLCQACFDREDVGHKSAHRFFQTTIEHDQRISDDICEQKAALWRCKDCPFVTGPRFPWSHEHFNINICLGSALIDVKRQSVLKSCLRNRRYWLALRDPPNAFRSACMTCCKPVAYNQWNRLCLQCNLFLCKACVEAGRGAHRHRLHSIIVVRKSGVQTNPWSSECTCDGCRTPFYGDSFSGMTCMSCKSYYYCSKVCLASRRSPVAHEVCTNGQLSTWSYISD